jgi:hypothetical protein
MVPTNLPVFESLTVTNRQSKSVTFLSFGTFEFDQVWGELQRVGATSCNIHSDTDNESIEFEVFFGGESATPLEKKAPGYSNLQLFISSACVVGISLCLLV